MALQPAVSHTGLSTWRFSPLYLIQACLHGASAQRINETCLLAELTKPYLNIRSRPIQDLLPCISQSLWSRGVRHESSSPAETLESWVRTPLEAWMFLFILCLCRLVCRYRPCEGLIPHPKSPTDCV
jgi:hypothetical protein